MDHPGMLGGRPLPAIEPHTAPYWAAARAGRLILQQCKSCRSIQFPPEMSCTHCGAAESAWIEASGRARLYSWTICHPPLLPYFAERAPWAVAAVELEEGVRMATQITGTAPEDYILDMPLVAEFEPIDDERAFVLFRPAAVSDSAPTKEE